MAATARKLSSPKKIQDFLDKLPFNFQKPGATYLSPKKVLERNLAHCFEGALLAALCLRYHGIENRLMDLKVKDLRKDSDHTLCLFRQNGFWGAVSKTNHAVLRWRDPIYRTPRELALSYFHEYFLDSGEKTLKSFSRPFDVWRRFGEEWIAAEEDLDEIAEALDRSPHQNFVPARSSRLIRKAGKTEIRGASITEWKNKRQND